MNVEGQKILQRRNVSHQRPPIIEMNCQVRSVVTLCILPTFQCPGKGLEAYQHELDVESIFRLTYEKSSILPVENCGMWVVGEKTNFLNSCLPNWQPYVMKGKVHIIKK